MIDPNWVIAVCTVVTILGGVCTFFWKDIDNKIGSVNSKVDGVATELRSVSTTGESTARELAELRGRFNEMRRSGGASQWQDER